MRYLFAAVGLLSILLVSGCSEDSALTPETELVVVEAYLYAGEAVNDIRLTKTISLSSEESAPPVNDAHVSLVKNGTTYALTQTPGTDGYYHYDGDDLSVDTGDEFTLFVDCNGVTATGTTRVPEAPENIEYSSSVIYVPTEFYSGSIDIEDGDYRIDITWNEEESALFYVAVENLESDPDPIEYSDDRFNNEDGIRRFVSTPRMQNEYSITFRNLSYYGEHTIRVYRVNQEYADLYTSRQQDSRDLNEPLTNIENGLGIFSAFNSGDTVSFVVFQE